MRLNARLWLVWAPATNAATVQHMYSALCASCCIIGSKLRKLSARVFADCFQHGHLRFIFERRIQKGRRRRPLNLEPRGGPRTLLRIDHANVQAQRLKRLRPPGMVQMRRRCTSISIRNSVSCSRSTSNSTYMSDGCSCRRKAEPAGKG